MDQAKKPPANRVQGADIEIIERSDSPSGVIIPNAVRINGAEILIPGDSTIAISEIIEGALMTATITMYVRSLSVRHESSPQP